MKNTFSFEKKYNAFVKIFINEFIKLGIEKNRILMLHVSLKDIASYTSFTYKDCTKLILDSLEYFSPKAVLVPSFTYSFVNSGVFSVPFSRSEVGRFSEEVRMNFSKYRLNDPIFSVLDTKKWLSKKAYIINTNQSFGHETIWSLLNKEDCLIVNIGLKHLILTHIHHIEEINNVPYRKIIVKKGVTYKNDFNYKKVEYNFYARNLDKEYALDWGKIESVLCKNNVLHKSQIDHINFSSLSTKKLHSVIDSLLDKDEFFLVKKIK